MQRRFFSIAVVIASIGIAIMIAFYSEHHTKSADTAAKPQLAGQLALPSTQPNGFSKK